MKKIFLILLFLTPCFLKAQDTNKVLIRAGKMFNSETGVFSNDMALLIEGKKIKIIKPYKEISEREKKEFELIDLSKYTILPGLIDAHTHLLNKETLMPDNKFSGLDMMKTLTMQGDAYRAIYGSVRAKAYLEAGIIYNRNSRPIDR